MTKGILILAAGHPYYGKMAAALAATLKAADVNTNIHIGYAGNVLKYLNEDELGLFNSSSEIIQEYYTYKGEPRYIMAKMFMYDISPFEETIYLDADIAWLKKPVADLFKLLKGVGITFSNHGFDAEHSNWADVAAVKKAYNITDEKYYQLHSEFVYFKKNKKTEAFFKKAQEVYKNLEVPATVFAGAIPDELPFTIAAMLTKTYPHKDVFHPFFWQNTDKKNLSVSELIKGNHYGLSMGGHRNPKMSIENYNIIVSSSYKKMQLGKPFKWQQKYSFLPERSKI